MRGSVKIMLSYDYSHFEVALSSDNDLDVKGVNSLRKTAQRLADEAVRQYKKAKENAALRDRGKIERQYFLEDIKHIERIPEGERTVEQIAMLKQYQDENWEAQFNHDYDYDDDDFDDDFEGAEDPV
jgi:hypothetical protein